MADTTKLTALRDRMAEAQRALLLQAAECDTLPASGALLQIAAMDRTLVAVETTIDEITAAEER